MKKSVTWKTQSGAEVKATCELVLKKTIFADGYNVPAKCCEKHFDISVEGHGSVGYGITRRSPKTIKGVSYSATCGKLAISADHLAEIDAMVTEVENHPAWIAKKAATARSIKAESEYYAHTARVKQAMSY